MTAYYPQPIGPENVNGRVLELLEYLRDVAAREVADYVASHAPGFIPKRLVQTYVEARDTFTSADAALDLQFARILERARRGEPVGEVGFEPTTARV